MKEKIKIAVIGSRGFHDYGMFVIEFEKFLKENDILDDNYIIISGAAKGADSLGRQYAYYNNIEIIEFTPDWNTYGKSAGFIRNNLIWENADIGIAFWDGQSTGTKHSFKIVCSEPKKLLKIINYVDKESRYLNDFLRVGFK